MILSFPKNCFDARILRSPQQRFALELTAASLPDLTSPLSIMPLLVTRHTLVWHRFHMRLSNLLEKLHFHHTFRLRPLHLLSAAAVQPDRSRSPGLLFARAGCIEGERALRIIPQRDDRSEIIGLQQGGRPSSGRAL